jgi:DNA-binding transcriptional ArsR family regulator
MVEKWRRDATEDADAVWKALSDKTRREILDFLRDGPRSTTEIVSRFPRLTRFGVMKHLDVLREAGLVHTRAAGRQRINSINVVPIRRIYERWATDYQDLWASLLTDIQRAAESRSAAASTSGAPSSNLAPPSNESRR